MDTHYHSIYSNSGYPIFFPEAAVDKERRRFLLPMQPRALFKGRSAPSSYSTCIAIDPVRHYTYSTRIQRLGMQKKLTITVDEKVYEGLHKTIGPRKISKFVEDLVRPHVIHLNLESAYADMARDTKREKEALEWADATFMDSCS